jgi:hypothetical protein
MITERLLQYIWQFQYFNKMALCTAEGESVQIIHPGIFNTNQGPDFLDAKLQIGDTIWAGNIELHINASDWNNHKHNDDINYKNVILHVVWQNDIPLHQPFSTLILQDKISKILLQQYDTLMNMNSFIPCEKMIGQVKALTWSSWKERLLVERLQQKSKAVTDYLTTNNYHWEETFWWMLAKKFGSKVNSDAFEKIAQSIPVNVLAKHKNQIHQLEALLFGQAGLLENNFTEDYPKLLQREYVFLNKKYQLKKITTTLHFLRMRPANFPTVRLAQLAMLIHNSLHLFATIKECNHIKEIKALLNVTANDYWHYHYLPDEPSGFKEKHLGTQMINNIIINTVVVVLFAYGHYHKNDHLTNKAMQWLEDITAEQNTITKGFAHCGISSKNAFDTQAIIQLKNEYCNKKKCLSCSVGNPILKSS